MDLSKVITNRVPVSVYEMNIKNPACSIRLAVAIKFQLDTFQL